MAKVKMKETLGSRLSSGAQDLAYTAANGIEDIYGRDLRARAKRVAMEIPVVKTILDRKNKPLTDT